MAGIEGFLESYKTEKLLELIETMMLLYLLLGYLAINHDYNVNKYNHKFIII